MNSNFVCDKSIFYSVTTGIFHAVVAIAVLVFFAGGCVTGPKGQMPGALRVSTERYDFKDVSLHKGVVSTTIQVVNIGNGPLKITALATSCGCTTARIVNQGKEGPLFTIIGSRSNTRRWSTWVAPGNWADLEIYYDPAVHPRFRGTVTRQVFIYSDDSENPSKEIRIRVNQID